MDYKYNILLVDDMLSSLIILENFLDDIPNIIIYQATSVTDALDVLKNQNIDLIISDIQMPNIDGYKFVTILKNNNKTKDIPFILVTAFYKDEEFKQKGFDLGAVDYLTKPVQKHRIINRVNLYIKIAKKQKELENIQIYLENKVDKKSKELNIINKSFYIAQGVAKIGHFEIDKDGEFLFWSHEIYKIFDIKDFTTKPNSTLCLNMVDDKVKKLLKTTTKKLLEDKKGYKISFDILTTKQNKKTITKTCQAQYDKDGVFKYFIGTIQDITNIANLENGIIKLSNKIAELSSEIIFVSRSLEDEIKSKYKDKPTTKTIETNPKLKEQRENLKAIRERLAFQQEALRKQNRLLRRDIV